MFIARVGVIVGGDDIDLSAKGLTLKIAYEALKALVREVNADAFEEGNVEYFEGEMIQVEIQITKKVVTIATPKARPAPFTKKK